MLSEFEYQSTRYEEAHKRLMGGVKVYQRHRLSREARNKMKALLDAQIKNLDIIPRGKRAMWIKAIMEADPEVQAMFAKEDKDWRKQVTEIIVEHGENLPRLRGGNRDANIVACRRAISIALFERGWSLPRIGHFMNRDHTSILSLLKNHRKPVESGLANAPEKAE